MGRFRWPYQEAPNRGYWGEVTATIDWCEENYVISHYIAEWSNTLTNITYLITAFYATYCAYRNELETRFILIGLGFALVGIGSWWFHMSLKYQYQLLDELPMIYATCIPAWSLVCEFMETEVYKRPSNKDKVKIQTVTGILVTLSVIILTIVYLYLKNPAIQEVGYGFFTVLVFFISGYLTYKHVQDPQDKSNLFYCMGLGAVMFVAGFGAWQLDVHFCPFWRNIRREYLQLPLGVLLELHGWWHVLTGLGVYYYIVFLQYLRILTSGQKDKIHFIWRWGILPELVKSDQSINTKHAKSFWGPYCNESVEHGPETTTTTTL